MKKKEIGSRLAFGGIGATVSLLFIVLGYFVRYISLSCVVLSSIGMMLPLSKNYYREGLLSAFVAGVIGFFIVNVKIVPFLLGSGFYVVATVFCHNRFSDKTWKIILSYVVKVAYSALIFWLCYSVLGLVGINVEKITFLQTLDTTYLYVVLNLLFTVCFLVYDYLLIKGYYYAREQIKKIRK